MSSVGLRDSLVGTSLACTIYLLGWARRPTNTLSGLSAEQGAKNWPVLQVESFGRRHREELGDLEELSARMIEFREVMQDALNSAIEKLASEMESLRHAQFEDNAAVREENHFLRVEMDRMMEKMKELVT